MTVKVLFLRCCYPCGKPDAAREDLMSQSKKISLLFVTLVHKLPRKKYDIYVICLESFKREYDRCIYQEDFGLRIMRSLHAGRNENT
jgi:hypothetical protein